MASNNNRMATQPSSLYPNIRCLIPESCVFNHQSNHSIPTITTPATPPDTSDIGRTPNNACRQTFLAQRFDRRFAPHTSDTTALPAHPARAVSLRVLLRSWTCRHFPCRRSPRCCSYMWQSAGAQYVIHMRPIGMRSCSPPHRRALRAVPRSALRRARVARREIGRARELVGRGEHFRCGQRRIGPGHLHERGTDDHATHARARSRIKEARV